MNEVLADLVLDVLDTLYGDPFVALVALALLNDGLLQLTWFVTFGAAEGGGRREWAAGGC